MDSNTATGGVTSREIAPHVVVNPEIRSGAPVIAGTRVPVTMVVGKLAGGMSAAEVAAEYDLSVDEVQAALDYTARASKASRRD